MVPLWRKRTLLTMEEPQQRCAQMTENACAYSSVPDRRHVLPRIQGHRFIRQAGSAMPAVVLVAAVSFSLCTAAPRHSCVVDGDTFWLEGEKIRIADINTPETHHPACKAELWLGKAAARRLVVLLNEGPFALRSGKRDRDRYGRKLRIVLREGESIGEQLVTESLAERWPGKRGDWCKS